MADFDAILKSSFDLDTEAVLKTLDTYELTEAQKGILATSIILDKIGSTRRTFAYAHPLAATDAACAPAFARSFVHADWQDGEDVVSAQGSNGDEGFNARFHKIEADLDALSTDNSKMFACMAELRADLATLLEEIRVELNRINTDLKNMRPSAGDVTLPPIYFPPEVYYPPNIGGLRPPYTLPPKITLPGVPYDPGNIYPVGPYVIPGFNTYPGSTYGTPTTLPGAGMVTTPGTVWTSREDATVGIIGGMRATRVNEGVFNGQKVELWSTPMGTVLTPVSGITDAPQGYLDPRLETTGRIGAWTATNADAIKDKFQGGSFTKADLERVFGDADIGGGLKLKEALRGVATGTSFDKAADIIDVVAEAQATAIKDAGAATVASIGSVGINVGTEGPEAAAVEFFAAATPPEAAALAAAGIKTVGDLATADTAKLATALKGPAGSLDAGRLVAGRLQGIALAVGRLGFRG